MVCRVVLGMLPFRRHTRCHQHTKKTTAYDTHFPSHSWSPLHALTLHDLPSPCLLSPFPPSPCMPFLHSACLALTQHALLSLCMPCSHSACPALTQHALTLQSRFSMNVLEVLSLAATSFTMLAGAFMVGGAIFCAGYHAS